MKQCIRQNQDEKKEGDNSPSAHKHFGSLISAVSETKLSLIATVLHCLTAGESCKLIRKSLIVRYCPSVGYLSASPQLVSVPFTFKCISEVSLSIGSDVSMLLFGIATTELLHSKDGYMTYDDYNSVADPGEGPGKPGPPPLFLNQTEARRAEKKFSQGLDNRASPLSEGLHGSVTAYQPS